mmetsp:Transcript_24258/g.37405  ORF Transcript_24258/g.37405 Transcript_24258/m.37405 type:complete len:163 (-) Transcript_24258:1094-1582(-)
MGTGGGGDSTLHMKSVYKSLKALAGDNDRIFAILDDRADPWQTRTPFIDRDGQKRFHIETPANLLQIPAYFFHFSRDAENLSGMTKYNCIQCNMSDLDLGLLTFRDFLVKVHSSFFKDLKQKSIDEVHTGEVGDIKKYLTQFRQEVFAKNNLINFTSFVRWQ